jgi:large subunit ribosomal protein L24e
MAKCSFCGDEIKKGSGKMFVRDNGTILYFCKSKCEKNMLKLKRDSRKFKWTTSYERGEAPVKGKTNSRKTTASKKTKK